MATEKSQLILPEGYESWLDIRTLILPEIKDRQSTPETDLHIVSDQPFDLIRTGILSLRGFALNQVESTIIPTKAVATINYNEFSRKEGYRTFQDCLLDEDLFGRENDFQGYMEFESWTPELIIPWSEYRNPNNLKLELPYLDPKSVNGNSFKRADLHLTVTKIDKIVEEQLLSLGFYYADFTNKEVDKNINSEIQTGLHRVLTIQNARISDTFKIKNLLENYIRQVGGVEGKIFVEPVLLYVRTKNNAVPPCSNVRIR